MREIKKERKKEEEQNVYLDGIEWIVKQIQLQMKTPPSTDIKMTDGVSASSGGKAKLLT